MNRSYHLVRINLPRLSRYAETVLESYDTYEHAISAASCVHRVAGERLVVRHMGLIVWSERDGAL